MKVRAVFLAGLAGLLVFGLAVWTKVPRHDRTWKAHLSRLPEVALDDETFSIATYRNWTYPRGEAPEPAWQDLAQHSIGDVRTVWFLVEPHPGLPVMAHTLVLFEFDTGDMIGLTVEARKEAGESYSALRGGLNAFELIYQWATPRDLLTRRAVFMEKELYRYRLELSQGEAEAYLRAVLEKTQAIEREPRFYNTLTSNCTNELAKAAGLPWHPAFVLTGGSAEALYEMGRISGPEDFGEVREAARIDDRVREIADLDEGSFNAALVSGR